MNSTNKELVAEIAKKMPKEEKLFDLAELYKVFGDSTRIKIISALLHEELCVCDLAEIIKVTPSATSHQLRILKQAKLIKYRKVGKTVYYSLADSHVEKIYAIGSEHIDEL